jgi:HemK-like putative methylase
LVPFQYIYLFIFLMFTLTGSQPFGSLNLLTRPPVLIPRPETEHWVIKLAERLSSIQTNHPRSLLDLGTGSGCIPLLLCSLCPPGTIHAHGLDISAHAIQLAMDNAAICSIPTPSHATMHHNTFKTTMSNILSPALSHDTDLEPPFDLVTSNPPYIPWKEYLELPCSVADYEDPKALFGGPTGLDFYHAIARLIRRKGFLRPGAIVALEVGHKQAGDVQSIMQSSVQWSRVEIWCDPWGKQRTVVANL